MGLVEEVGEEVKDVMEEAQNAAEEALMRFSAPFAGAAVSRTAVFREGLAESVLGKGEFHRVAFRRFAGVAVQTDDRRHGEFQLTAHLYTTSSGAPCCSPAEPLRFTKVHAVHFGLA